MAQSSHGFEWMESDIFLRSRLDDPNHVEMPDKIAVFAQRILAPARCGSEAGRCPHCPPGKSFAGRLALGRRDHRPRPHLLSGRQREAYSGSPAVMNASTNSALSLVDLNHCGAMAVERLHVGAKRRHSAINFRSSSILPAATSWERFDLRRRAEKDSTIAKSNDPAVVTATLTAGSRSSEC